MKRYKKLFKEEKSKEDYIQLFTGYEKKVNEFLKLSQEDDKKKASTHSSAEWQKYNKKLDNNLFEMLKNAYFRYLKSAGQEKYLPVSFVNGLIKEFNSNDISKSLFQGTTAELEKLLSITDKVLKKLK